MCMPVFMKRQNGGRIWQRRQFGFGRRLTHDDEAKPLAIEFHAPGQIQHAQLNRSKLERGCHAAKAKGERRGLDNEGATLVQL
jgi:hypothetical protein